MPARFSLESITNVKMLAMIIVMILMMVMMIMMMMMMMLILMMMAMISNGLELQTRLPGRLRFPATGLQTIPAKYGRNLVYVQLHLKKIISTYWY